MNKPLIVIYTAICLDAVGVGLIFPILPGLLADVTHVVNVAPYMGITIALYALMQFLFALVLGALSDRFGRRPVLLVSLAGAAIDYVVMAFAPQLWLLFVGRAIAGLTGANMSVATTYLTDISPEDQRARRFGILNAMFGVGFIAGPVLGGVLGDYWLRLPFIAAAVLNAGNLLLAFLFLPESRPPSLEKVSLEATNPARQLRWMFSTKRLVPITAVFFVLSATGEAYGTCWALWGHDVFGWNGLWAGLSLGAFGVCQSLGQGLLPDIAVTQLGERKTVLVGIAGSCVALVALAFARQSWNVFAVMPVLALGGLGAPVLQSFATRLVGESQQGQLQGGLTSVMSLASIIGPLVFSTLYSVVRQQWPGAVWLTVAILFGTAVPLVLRLQFSSDAVETAQTEVTLT